MMQKRLKFATIFALTASLVVIVVYLWIFLLSLLFTWNIYVGALVTIFTLLFVWGLSLSELEDFL